MVKQHKRVNDNSVNKLFLLYTFKQIELPRVNDTRLNITNACDYLNEVDN